ncbi:unnamed protein product [Microthlaspi erraticum]|uniref:Uncharacterized protein n=1 Tax=Microthlaspi erraticum TaxID=1685480 RepID=A0A6D2K606_9BRAS|nr:unnamed protein product [Microthlaspi erraticum]
MRNLRETNPDRDIGMALRSTAKSSFLRLIMEHGIAGTNYLTEVSTNFLQVFIVPAVQEFEQDLEALTQHCHTYPQILVGLIDSNFNCSLLFETIYLSFSGPEMHVISTQQKKEAYIGSANYLIM